MTMRQSSKQKFSKATQFSLAGKGRNADSRATPLVDWNRRISEGLCSTWQVYTNTQKQKESQLGPQVVPVWLRTLFEQRIPGMLYAEESVLLEGNRICNYPNIFVASNPQASREFLIMKTGVLLLLSDKLYCSVNPTWQIPQVME